MLHYHHADGTVNLALMLVLVLVLLLIVGGCIGIYARNSSGGSSGGTTRPANAPNTVATPSR
jgi:hypothetical protein